MNIRKIVYASLGCVSLGLGAVGAVMPLMPAFPFLLFAAFCFTKSSKRLDEWFKSTKLCKNHLETYVKGKGMTVKTKIRIMVLVTVLLGIGFILMNAVIIGRIILFFVWLFHIIYFLFGVKTIKQGESA